MSNKPKPGKPDSKPVYVLLPNQATDADIDEMIRTLYPQKDPKS